MIVTIKPQTVTIIAAPSNVGITLQDPIARDYVERDPYTGDYSITPGAEAVVLSVKDKRMTDDVVVNPVPSNYGRITWNGAILTVS